MKTFGSAPNCRSRGIAAFTHNRVHKPQDHMFSILLDVLVMKEGGGHLSMCLLINFQLHSHPATESCIDSWGKEGLCFLYL